MADLPLRVAVVAPEAADPALAPALVSGGAATWLRARRSEPFAACVSGVGFSSDGPSARVLAQLESGFRAASRYSITTSLSRAVHIAHACLREENRATPEAEQRVASVVAAAARPNGVYVARSGAGLVASVRAAGAWARSGDPSGREMADPERGLGQSLPPQIISEFFPFSEGDLVLLVPGVGVSDIPDYVLSDALNRPLETDALAGMLDRAPSDTAALIVWWPPRGDVRETESRWVDWAHPTRSLKGVLAALAPSRPVEEPVAPRPAASERETEVPSADSMPFPPPGSGGPGAAAVRQGQAGVSSDDRRTGWTGWTRLAALLPLGVLLAVALLLLRGVGPLYGGPDQAIADAWHVIQEAEAQSDPDAKADLLTRAIHILEPKAPRDEAAQVLLQDAQKARDQVRNVIRVSRVHRFNLAVEEPFRPAGLWKSDDGLFILDLGGQVLYRTDATGTQLTRVLKPGEPYEEQPLGLLVTAAFSPPRGANTDGRFLVVDHLRSMVSLPTGGAAARRWWPPDSSMWQRIGPAAATHEDLYLLDKDRAEVWRYPARLAGAAGSVAADQTREPQLGSALDIATDGNLYVLLPGGTISKLAPGAGKLPFDGTVPDRPLTSPNALFTQPDLDRVWVLEPPAGRVVELTAQGVYVRQFVFPPEMVWNAIALHVDARNRDLRVLTPQHVLLVQME